MEITAAEKLSKTLQWEVHGPAGLTRYFTCEVPEGRMEIHRSETSYKKNPPYLARFFSSSGGSKLLGSSTYVESAKYKHAIHLAKLRAT